jgi:hypothetical protein
MGTSNPMQAAKHGAKETSRQHIIASKLQHPDSTPTNQEAVIKLMKAKQAAVSSIICPTKKQTKKQTRQSPTGAKHGFHQSRRRP